MSFDFEKIIPLIPYILSIFTFFIGMSVENYRIKNSNIREKAKELDERIMKILKNCAKKTKQQIHEMQYISVGKIGLKLDNCDYVRILDSSDIFNVKDGKISLIYQKDGILCKHAKIIIQNIENYNSEVSHLKNLIENINKSNIPQNFEGDLRDLLKNEFGKDNLETGKRLDELLFTSYILSITGSKNSYTSGRTWLVKIIENRYNDLQNIARNNSESNENFVVIQNRLTNIISCLNNLINEIEELHKEWLNKYII